jgi:endonuclease/exonuclease/phosphatase family metal-dependent hydrolase
LPCVISLHISYFSKISAKIKNIVNKTQSRLGAFQNWKSRFFILTDNILIFAVSMKQMRKFFNISFLIIIATIPFGLCITFLCAYISPTKLWMPNMVGLGFPFLLFLSAILGIVYLFLLKRRCIIFFAAIILNTSNIIHYVRISSPNEETEKTSKQENSIKILSYNVNLFDFYAHIDKRNATKKKILDFISGTKTDIICFEEYYETKNGSFSIAEHLIDNGYTYYTKRNENNKAYYGNVIYSRFPIINEGVVTGLSPLYAYFADIVISPKDTIRIFNIHLYSNKLDKSDHAFYSSLISRKENVNYKTGISKIFDKIYSSAKIRGEQISLLLESISKTHYPVILCGDMNETPISYCYNQFKKNLNDVFLELGSGTGSTYNGIFPAYRIDYIFYRQSDNINSAKKIAPIYFETFPVKYSDHFPVSALFEII